MATVSEQIAKEIIANDGYYRDDPRVMKVVTYENDFNRALCWAIVYPLENQMRYEESPSCHNVQVMWRAGTKDRRIFDNQPGDDRRGKADWNE